MGALARGKGKDIFESLREDIDQAFHRWLPARFFSEEAALPTAFWSNGGPALDMDEDEKQIHVRAELPGVGKDDLKVEIEGDRLFIHGEKKSSKEEKKKDYLYKECSYGSFARSVLLPSEVVGERAEATFRDGILDLKLPKSESGKAKRTAVKVT
ncbi:MAG: Hsp20/alpha crystallin family protein [Planctomycetota bacterium]|nr:Hsp20/alpha crystallin family protein [Planctomycetota bacterium]